MSDRFGIWVKSFWGGSDCWVHGRGAGSVFVGSRDEAELYKTELAASWGNYRRAPQYEVRPMDPAGDERRAAHLAKMAAIVKTDTATTTSSLCACCSSLAFRLFTTEDRIKSFVATKAERPEDVERVQRTAFERDEFGVRTWAEGIAKRVGGH